MRKIRITTTEKLWTYQEIAAHLQVCQHTVMSLIRKHGVTKLSFSKRTTRFPDQTIQQLIQKVAHEKTKASN